MTTYTIIFYNERKQAGQYAVFTSPPEPTPGTSVFSNVWQSFNAAIGGNFKISSTTNYFACQFLARVARQYLFLLTVLA